MDRLSAVALAQGLQGLRIAMLGAPTGPVPGATAERVRLTVRADGRVELVVEDGRGYVLAIERADLHPVAVEQGATTVANAALALAAAIAPPYATEQRP